MKFIFGALTAVTLLVGVAASQPAEARCFWNGYAMECYPSYPSHFRHFHQWGGPFYDRPYIEPY
jgi:hypothetical protein